MKRTKTRTIRFDNPEQSKRWLAQMNEQNFCYKAAARLYREIGDEEAASRCEKMSEVKP